MPVYISHRRGFFAAKFLEDEIMVNCLWYMPWSFRVCLKTIKVVINMMHPNIYLSHIKSLVVEINASALHYIDLNCFPLLTECSLSRSEKRPLWLIDKL